MYNGNSILITSAKQVDLFRTREDEYSKYLLKFDPSYCNIFYLWINGDGWDYLANFSKHPYNQSPIRDER